MDDAPAVDEVRVLGVADPDLVGDEDVPVVDVGWAWRPGGDRNRRQDEETERCPERDEPATDHRRPPDPGDPVPRHADPRGRTSRKRLRQRPDRFQPVGRSAGVAEPRRDAVDRELDEPEDLRSGSDRRAAARAAGRATGPGARTASRCTGCAARSTAGGSASPSSRWSRPVTASSSRTVRSCSASISSQIRRRTGPAASAAYVRATPMSAFARIISALSSIASKSGHDRYRAASSSSPASPGSPGMPRGRIPARTSPAG